MRFRPEQRHKLRSIGKTGLLAFGIFYFSYHIMSGDKGILTMMQLEQKVASVKEESEQVAQERERLKDKVQRLYAKSLDKDVLDERSRRQLGVSGKNEVIYFTE